MANIVSQWHKHVKGVMKPEKYLHFRDSDSKSTIQWLVNLCCIYSGLLDKKCALCNRGEKSLLGQGELKQYESTPGFNPFKRQVTRAGAKRALSDTDEMSRRGQQHTTWRRTRGPVKQQSRYWIVHSCDLIAVFRVGSIDTLANDWLSRNTWYIHGNGNLWLD